MPLIEELSAALEDFQDDAPCRPRRIYMTEADLRGLAAEAGLPPHRVDGTPGLNRFLGVPIKITPNPGVQCWLDCAEWRIETANDARTA